METLIKKIDNYLDEKREELFIKLYEYLTKNKQYYTFENKDIVIFDNENGEYHPVSNLSLEENNIVVGLENSRKLEFEDIDGIEMYLILRYLFLSS